MYNKCCVCGEILDPDVACDYAGKTYCIDCYDAIVTEIQDKELTV